MDLVRSCYRTRMRFWRGSDRTVAVRWFFTPPGAKLYQGYNRFASLNWENRPWRDTGLGEDPAARRTYDRGRPNRFLRGDRVCGTPAMFAEGLDPDAVYPPEPRDQGGIPACCGYRWGGVYVTGRARVTATWGGTLKLSRVRLGLSGRCLVEYLPDRVYGGRAPLTLAGTCEVSAGGPPGTMAPLTLAGGALADVTLTDPLESRVVYSGFCSAGGFLVNDAEARLALTGFSVIAGFVVPDAGGPVAYAGFENHAAGILGGTTGRLALSSFEDNSGVVLPLPTRALKLSGHCSVYYEPTRGHEPVLLLWGYCLVAWDI